MARFEQISAAIRGIQLKNGSIYESAWMLCLVSAALILNWRRIARNSSASPRCAVWNIWRGKSICHISGRESRDQLDSESQPLTVMARKLFLNLLFGQTYTTPGLPTKILPSPTFCPWVNAGLPQNSSILLDGLAVRPARHPGDKWLGSSHQQQAVRQAVHQAARMQHVLPALLHSTVCKYFLPKIKKI